MARYADVDKLAAKMDAIATNHVPCESEYEEGVADTWENAAECAREFPAKDGILVSWIPVSDHMPEDDLPEGSNRKEIRVLGCTAGNPVSMKKLSRSLRYGIIGFGKDGVPLYGMRWEWSRDIRNITHWMYPIEVPGKEED